MRMKTNDASLPESGSIAGNNKVAVIEFDGEATIVRDLTTRPAPARLLWS